MENQNTDTSVSSYLRISNSKNISLYFVITFLILSNVFSYFYFNIKNHKDIQVAYNNIDMLPFCKNEIVNNFKDEDYINYIITYNYEMSIKIKKVLPKITKKENLDILNTELNRLEKESDNMKTLYKNLYKKEYMPIEIKSIKMLTEQPFTIDDFIDIKNLRDESTVISLFRGSLELISRNYYSLSMSSKNVDIVKSANDFFEYKNLVIENIKEANY